MRISDWSSDVCSSDLMQHCDVLIAVGARFDDRVIGNTKHFSQTPRKIVHIDIDPSSISKRVRVDVPIVGNVKDVLQEMNSLYAQATVDTPVNKDTLAKWWPQINTWRGKQCLVYENRSEENTSELQSLMSTSYAVSGW